MTGALTRTIPSTVRAPSGAVSPGTYTLAVTAANPCGTSAVTAPQTVTV